MKAKSSTTIRSILNYLIERDIVLKSLISSLPEIELRREHDHFERMVRIIVSQQLSTKAASTINGRLFDLMRGQNTLEFLYSVDPNILRSIGISNQKASFIKGLSNLIFNDQSFFSKLSEFDDDEAIRALTSIKGIGKWTAEIFLMFSLNRLDVLPTGDVGILNAVQKYYKLENRPNVHELNMIAESWRPYRTIACWYLWKGFDNLIEVR